MKYLCLDQWQNEAHLDRLNSLSRPPKKLCIRGEWNPHLFQKCVAVVGSRRLTTYGKQVIEMLVPQLVLQGNTIISGFMYGVDQYAHRVCIDCGGKTVAVLGWGISNSMDSQDEALAIKIEKSGGLLLSEWESQLSMLWTFPVRNRIVAALSSDIFVIEAAIKSGSLLTAQWGNKLKRNVWAVPGPITSRVSHGTNALIASGQAQAWLGKTQSQQTERINDPVLNLLMNEPLSANELAVQLRLPVAEIGAQLSLLTVTGQLLEREGKYYIDNAG